MVKRERGGIQGSEISIFEIQVRSVHVHRVTRSVLRTGPEHILSFPVIFPCRQHLRGP